MAGERNAVKGMYSSVMNDVIDGVREAFLDDGMDDIVLQELKQLWESKVAQCKAVDRIPPPTVVPNRAQVTIPPIPSVAANQQLMHPGVAQLHQPGVMQPQLMRMQATGQPPGAVYGNVSQLTQSAQLAANSLTAAAFQPFLRQFVNYGPGQNQIVLQGRLPTAVAPVAAVAPADVGMPVTSKPIIQLDGLGDSSSEDDEDHDDDDNDDDEDDEHDADGTNVDEEDPLNSGDDVSDADPTEVFDAENVVVCQFEKINRCKNRWKFHLKDGIMNLNGRDYLFQKANGDAEW